MPTYHSDPAVAPAVRAVRLTPQRRALLRRLTLAAALALFVALIPAHSYAQSGSFSMTGFAASALTYVKQAWALIAVVEIVALIYYVIAYFSQGIAPALFQPVSGPWVKTAVLVGVGAQVLMGVLVGLATTSAGGWTGS